MTQNKTNNNPKPGFKHTKIGWIPVEWEVVRIQDITSLVTNGFVGKSKNHYVDKDEGILYIQGYNVEAFRFNFKGVKYVSKQFHVKNAKSKLRDKDLLIVQTGDVGLTGFVSKELEGSNCHALIVTRFEQDRVDPLFQHQYLNSPTGRARLKRIETGSTMKHLNVKDIKKEFLPLPPLPEQTVIATCLSTWDQAITTTRNLLQQLETRKRGLMQRLLTGEVRLPGFEGEWKEVKVGQFLTESRLPGSNGLDAEKLTVKLWGRGVRRKIDKQPGSVNTNYFKRKSGQLIYSKLDFLNCAFGIVPDHLHGLESTLDLPTFDFNDQVAPKFILERIKQKSFYEKFGERANGSRRARRIHPDMFLSFSIKLPSLKEQTAIAAVLTAADKEITLYKEKLATLETQKRGLMQQLLTGQKRFSA